MCRVFPSALATKALMTLPMSIKLVNFIVTHIAQHVVELTQGREGLVDVARLFQSLACSIGVALTLRAGKIDEIKASFTD